MWNRKKKKRKKILQSIEQNLISVPGYEHRIRRLFGDENGEGSVNCCSDLLGTSPGLGAGAQILLPGVWHKTEIWGRRQRDIKRQLNENFSDLRFCLISCSVLSFEGLIWDFWRKGDWIRRGKDLATLNKEYTRKLSRLFIVKNLADVDYRGSISYACNILGDLLHAKN